MVIAGGLTADNVAGLARHYNVYGVDVSSGMEVAPSIKSRERMQAFIRAARARAESTTSCLGMVRVVRSPLTLSEAS
ncbi:N-(5'-phosphoribosyl)anthranilate isomerase [compost metagenome]